MAAGDPFAGQGPWSAVPSPAPPVDDDSSDSSSAASGIEDSADAGAGVAVGDVGPRRRAVPSLAQQRVMATGERFLEVPAPPSLYEGVCLPLHHPDACSWW